jgi:predicted CXXCH cytochrome family protein
MIFLRKKKKLLPGSSLRKRISGLVPCRRSLFVASALFLLPLCFFLSACDQVARHKVLTTIFEGVPSLPPADEYCATYHEEEMAKYLAMMAGKELAALDGDKAVMSRHKPFDEKKCRDCHDFETKVGLVRPPRELCQMCHTDFIQGDFVHGPVSVGDCSACHLPHSSQYPSLLLLDKNRICGKCHTEKRLAANMHTQVMAKGMNCVDCHDPHFGDAMYFLK